MLLKSIKDIQIENGIWTITRSDILSLDIIYDNLLSFSYSGTNRIVDQKIENAIFPPFAQVFYSLIYQFKKLPSEDDFFSEYLKWLKVELKNLHFVYKNEQYSIDGLKARIFRTYPSLIREIHFYYYLLNSKEFDNVNYSLSKDYFEGIDITIMYNKVKYSLSIHTATNRAKKYKITKNDRHNYNDVNEIVLSDEFHKLNKFGDFYLLGDFQLKELLENLNHRNQFAQGIR
ncbi:MAG: hypothetical protein V4663_09855 [Bacteroidota bacterium]